MERPLLKEQETHCGPAPAWEVVLEEKRSPSRAMEYTGLSGRRCGEQMSVTVHGEGDVEGFDLAYGEHVRLACLFFPD